MIIGQGVDNKQINYYIWLITYQINGKEKYKRYVPACTVR